MDRRSFLVGAGSAIITTSFYKDVVRYTERKDAPLIVPPDNYNAILYALDDEYGGFDLYLGKHPLEDHPPSWTWGEYLEGARGWDKKQVRQFLAENYGVSLREARDFVDHPASEDDVLEWYLRRRSASAKAFYELQQLDLGPEFDGEGEIRFIDGPCPGNDSLIVTADDSVSLSLLQARLTELNSGILVKPSTWRIEALA
jgi:hypothetical protein